MNGQQTTIDELMDFLQKNMLTKEDAKAFVAKDRFDELIEFLQQNMLTKEDTKNLVTKEDFDKKYNQIMNSLDGLTQRFTKFEVELAANQFTHNNFDQRITKLEGQAV